MTNNLTVPQWSALPGIFPPERQEYNQLRGRFAVLSRAAMDAFSSDYDAQIEGLDELVEKASDLANPHILAAIDAGIKLLVERRVFDIDKQHFTEQYWHPYDSWTPAFEHIADQLAEIVHSAEELDEYRTARREGRGRIIGGGFGVGGAVKGMAAAGAANLVFGASHAVFNLAAKGVSAIGDSLKKRGIFDDAQTKRGLVDALGKSVLAVHLAVLDALAAAKVDGGLQRIPAADEAKAQRMLANLRQGMLGDAEAGGVLTEILTLNPYLHDAYTHALDALGDASGELERVAAFFHVDLADEKKARVRPLIKTGNAQAMRDSIREVNEAGQRLGVAVEDEFLKPLNQRLAELDLIARTVEGTVYPTLEEAQAAEARLKAERAERVRAAVDKAKRGTVWVVKAVGYTFAALVALCFVLGIVLPLKEQAGTAESTAVAAAPADTPGPAVPPAESASQAVSTETAAPADTAAPAPGAATSEPPAVGPPSKPIEVTGTFTEVQTGDYVHCIFKPTEGPELDLWPTGVEAEDCRTNIGKLVRVRFTVDKQYIPEAGVESEVAQLTAIETLSPTGGPAETGTALIAAQPAEWTISEERLFGTDQSPQVKDLIALLGAPPDETGSPVSEAELRAVLRDARASQVYYAELIKAATPPSPPRPGVKPSKPVSYVDVFLKPSKLKAASDFLAAHGSALTLAQQRHGVDPKDVVAILLWQSNLGKVSGQYRTLNLYLGQALFLRGAYVQAIAAGATDAPTKAHEQTVERNATAALKTAATLLRSCKAKRIDPLDVKGVIGGGSGYAQFTPSGFRWLEDGDGDGKIQLDSFADAIMSIASCLDTSGYRSDRKKGVRGYNPGDEWSQGVMRVGDAIALAAQTQRNSGDSP